MEPSLCQKTHIHANTFNCVLTLAHRNQDRMHQFLQIVTILWALLYVIISGHTNSKCVPGTSRHAQMEKMWVCVCFCCINRFHKATMSTLSAHITAASLLPCRWTVEFHSPFLFAHVDGDMLSPPTCSHFFVWNRNIDYMLRGIFTEVGSVGFPHVNGIWRQSSSTQDIKKTTRTPVYILLSSGQHSRIRLNLCDQVNQESFLTPFFLFLFLFSSFF